MKIRALLKRLDCVSLSAYKHGSSIVFIFPGFIFDDNQPRQAITLTDKNEIVTFNSGSDEVDKIILSYALKLEYMTISGEIDRYREGSDEIEGGVPIFVLDGTRIIHTKTEVTKADSAIDLEGNLLENLDYYTDWLTAALTLKWRIKKRRNLLEVEVAGIDLKKTASLQDIERLGNELLQLEQVIARYDKNDFSEP